MLRFNELEKNVEYKIVGLGVRKNCRYRINEYGTLECSINKDDFVSSSLWYNEAISATFEPCEWVPKIGEEYYVPSPYNSHHFYN